MRKIIALFFLGFFLMISCKSKVINRSIPIDKNVEINYIPYYLKVYEADSLYIVKEYEKSYLILDSLFRFYKPIQMLNYYEVSNYYKLKIILNKNIDINNFSKLISEYRLTDVTLKNDSVFSIYYNKNKLHFDINYLQLRNIQLKKINIDLRNEIKKMNSDDQLYRNKDYKINISKQNKIDSTNSERIKQIFQIVGYPNESIIGEFNIDNTFVDIGTMLLHTKDSERIDYYLPIILEFVKKGSAPPRVYATLIDQYKLYHGEDQYYGTYETKFQSQTSKSELNIRRNEIGLPSHSYEKWRFKKLYPEEDNY